MSVQTMNYVCVHGVIAPGADKTVYQPGDVLPHDFPEHIAKAHVAEGFCKEITGSGLIIATESEIPVVMHGKWAFSPGEVAKKSLKALNTLIAERDPSVAPFKAKKDAVAHLTSDYRG